MFRCLVLGWIVTTGTFLVHQPTDEIGRSGVDVAPLQDVLIDAEFIEQFQITFLSDFADDIVIPCAATFPQTALIVGDGEHIGAVVRNGEESY